MSAGIKTRQVSVGTTATRLSSDTYFGSSIAIEAGSVDLFIGDSAVTTSGATGGFKVTAGATIALDLGGEDVFGVVASGTSTVYVLETGL
jgi:hypothetical protein